MYLALGGAILNASLSYYLIPFWKLKGAAWATNFSSLISAILILFLLYYYFKINFPWLTLIRSFLGGLGIFLLVHFFPQQNLIFIFSSLILIFIYFMLLYILGEIQQKDFFFWKKTILFQTISLRIIRQKTNQSNFDTGHNPPQSQISSA